MRKTLKQYDSLLFSRFGYSIGIGFCNDWSEKEVFLLHSSSTHVLREGMTLHLIPWMQVEGQGSIGFSDIVLVTKTGCTSLFP
jgi:Xaa-Pro dipeptidase